MKTYILPHVGTSVQSLLGKPILHDGKAVGAVKAVFFNSETGKFTGVQTDSQKGYSAEDVLIEAEAIHTTANEPRTIEGENWLGFEAQSAKGNHLGTISDVEFAPDMQIMTKLLVTQSILFVPIHKRTFSCDRIIDVRDKTVVFNCDTTLQEKIPAAINSARMDISPSQDRCYSPTKAAAESVN